ncbi:hypothetical protein [Rubrimonas cliftonensis]|uniref:Uncharacterized protein n=1 Tax=Rubrimonas cliftonensis TaxID=89524 RepID=A0A1H3XJF3_9RHOB|nr:hypothetical protein [Rubrimonas cliftonensis]SDZ98774.1 hypothetical protein SAMN05444370_102426 [Rubrimonas cliftonensis]
MNGIRAACASIGFTLATVVVGPAALALSAPLGPVGGPVLVIAPPWLDAAAAAEAAGGRIIALREAPLATLAVFGSPDFAPRLRAAGAFAANGLVVAELCGVETDDGNR